MTNIKQDTPNPEVFISYSWTSQAHEEWVLQLATELRGDGVNVLLDKWDLKEGQDKYSFMESMVTNPSISKVLIICDKKYSDKANDRKGGVGTETQIISPEIYGKAEQNKFIPIIVQMDEKGNPYLPIFLKTRMYIDFSTLEKYNSNYERLLRIIFNKPELQKPELGTPPKRIFEESGNHPVINRKYHICIQAAESGTKILSGALTDYYKSIIDILSSFIIDTKIKDDIPFDEKVFQSIIEFQPYRDEIVSLWDKILLYQNNDSLIYDTTHDFLENFIPFSLPENADNFKFFIYELFIYLIAVLMKHKRYHAVTMFLDEPYFIRDSRNPPGYYGSYEIFYARIPSIDVTRNKRLKSRRMSIIADIIKSRSTVDIISFEEIMLADFIIMLWTLVNKKQYAKWYPRTLIFFERFKSFEFFARAASHKQFSEVKELLQIKDKNDLIERLERGMKSHNTTNVGSFGNPSNIPKLMNLDELDTI